MSSLWPVPVRAIACYDHAVFVASDRRLEHYEIRPDGTQLHVVSRELPFDPDYCVASHSTSGLGVVVASSGAPCHMAVFRGINLEMWFESTLPQAAQPWAVCDAGVVVSEDGDRPQLLLLTRSQPSGISVVFTGPSVATLTSSTAPCPVVQIDCADLSIPTATNDTSTSVVITISTTAASYIGTLSLVDGTCEVVPIGSKARSEGRFGGCFLGDRFIALRQKGRIFCGTAFAPFTVEQTIKMPGLEDGVVSRTSHPNLFTVVASTFVALCDLADPAFLHVEHVTAASPVCGACLAGPLLLVWDRNKRCTMINMSSHSAFHSYAKIAEVVAGAAAGEAASVDPSPHSSPGNLRSAPQPQQAAAPAPLRAAHHTATNELDMPADGTSFLQRSTDDAPHPSHKKYFRRLSDRLLLHLEVSSTLDHATVTDYQISQLRDFVSEIVPSIRLAEVERGRPRTSRREGYQLWWQDEWRNRAFELIANTVLLMVRQHRTQPGGANYDLVYVAEESTRAMPSMLLGNYDAVAVCGEIAAERDAPPATAFDAIDGASSPESPLLVSAYDLTAITCVSTLRALDCTSHDIVLKVCTSLLSWSRADPNNKMIDNLRVSRLRERLAADVASLAIDGKLPALNPAAVHAYEQALAKRSTKLATEVELALFEMDGRITRLLEPQAALPMVLIYLPYVFAALPSKAIMLAVAHFPVIPVTFVRWALSQSVQRLAARVLLATNPRCAVDESGAHPDVFADYAMLLMQSETDRLYERMYPCTTLLSALISLFQTVALPGHAAAVGGGPQTFAVGGGSINGDGGIKTGAGGNARVTDAFVDERRERQVAMLIDDLIARGAATLRSDMPALRSALITTSDCAYARGILAFGLARDAIDHALNLQRVDLLWPLCSAGRARAGDTATTSDVAQLQLSDSDWQYLLSASYNKAQLLPAALMALQALGSDSGKVKFYLTLCFPDAEAKARIDEQLRKVLDVVGMEQSA